MSRRSPLLPIGPAVLLLALACGGENYIETVWGRGYVLRDPEEQAQAA